MATKHEIQAEARKDEGKGASRRLRRSGKIPAVVYGAKQDATSIQLDHNATMHHSKNEWFYSAILDLTVGGKTQKVLLRDMQRHPFKPEIMHIDFQRISENEAIRVRVPLHFLNQEKSPAGKAAGVVITHELNEVTIACLPRDLPEFISVDLSELAEGDTTHLSDLKLPEGVSIPELRFGKEHDVAVVVARKMKEEAEPAPAEGAAAAPAAGAAAAAPAAGAKGAAPAKAAPAKAPEKKK